MAIVNMLIKNISNWEETWQLRALHGSSLNDEESLISLDKQQLTPKHIIHRYSDIDCSIP